MNDRLYEVISLAARYWFALLGLLIVWRTFSWLRRDRRRKHKRLKQLPDAGTIGDWVVIRGCAQLPAGDALPIPWEGVVGFGRGCDVVLPAPGVRAVHAFCSFEEGKGLLVLPKRGRTVVIDGTAIRNRADALEHRMRHGSFIEIGDAVLRLHVLMGLGMEHTVPRVQDEPPRRAYLPDPVAAVQPMPNHVSNPVPERQRMPMPMRAAHPQESPQQAQGVYPPDPQPVMPPYGRPVQPETPPSPLDGLRPVRRYRSAGRRSGDEP